LKNILQLVMESELINVVVLIGAKLAQSTQPMKRLLPLVAATVLAGFGSASAQQKIGYVLGMRGTWTLSGDSHGLTLGQSLPAMGLLVNSTPQNGDNIVVADLSGEVIKIVRCNNGMCRECRQLGGCYDPIQQLPGVPDKASAFGTALSAVLDLFTGKPDRYSVHRVRGTVPMDGAAGIAQLEGYTVDISRFMEGLDKGAYEVQVASLDGVGGKERKWRSSPTTVNWNPGDHIPLVLKGIQPGLYVLSFENKGTSGFAWVLFCDPGAYPSAVASFDRFSKQVEMWGDSVTENTKKSYQRAYLDYLASSKSNLAQ
jgi:hypothetical protein